MGPNSSGGECECWLKTGAFTITGYLECLKGKKPCPQSTSIPAPSQTSPANPLCVMPSQYEESKSFHKFAEQVRDCVRSTGKFASANASKFLDVRLNIDNRLMYTYGATAKQNIKAFGLWVKIFAEGGMAAKINEIGINFAVASGSSVSRKNDGAFYQGSTPLGLAFAVSQTDEIIYQIIYGGLADHFSDVDALGCSTTNGSDWTACLANKFARSVEDSYVDNLGSEGNLTPSIYPLSKVDLDK